MPIHRDYRDLLNEFNGADVRYLVVGAHALAFHTEPRYTKDLDLWVEPSADNAKRTYAALARFGAPLKEIKIEDLATPGLVYQIGVEPVRVDILTSLTGIEFGDAYAHRMEGTYGGVPISILSAQDMITNKVATGRPQDLVDVERLRRKIERPE